MKGAASCIRHEEDKKKNRDFEYDYFPSILCINFQSGLKIPFLIIRFVGNERRSVPRLQIHLGDIAYKFVVLYLFCYICLFQFIKHDLLFSFSQLNFYFQSLNFQ
jgi:hypothetical protein